jgi:isopenicillin N synthase-like dioxygenase
MLTPNSQSTITMLFQDERGGLELQDPQTKEFLHAQPEDGALVLNVGDMLQRFTNGPWPRFL